MWADSDLSSLAHGPIRFFPVLPGRMEFAIAVRRAILREQPEIIALELPPSLERSYRAAVERLPQISVILYEGENEEDAIYVPVEPCDPFVEALRTAMEIGAKVEFTEPDLLLRPHIYGRAPDPYSLRFTGYDRYVGLFREASKTPAPAPVLDSLAKGIAWKLQGIDPFARTLAVVSLDLLEPVLRAMQEPQDEPERTLSRREISLLNPHPECLAEILTEYPFLQEKYEQFRLGLIDDVDRARVQLDVMRHAEETYRKNTGDEMASWHRRLLARYTRNLALAGGDLTAGVFDLAVAGRSIVDDNFGWEVWESANRYPSQREVSSLETVNISGDQVWIHSRKLRLRRRLPRSKQKPRPSALKKRKKERRPGEWAEQIDGESICSYPPEDLVIENYGRFLKQKAKSILSDERERVVPFSTSMLDGIDLRETIRNWHERKIYVKHQQRAAGDVGSVVVIFDEDREDRYSYLTTWLGEHQNESDMAFYATHPFEHMVGPGIGRAEYGGFLMTLPPRRMYDVWSDPDYNFAETKAERLLLAGIDYSIGRIVAYAAPKPPRSIFRSIAARMGHQILYIPLGQLSPAKLKKLRVVHVLDGHARRRDAKDYIW